MQHRPQIHELAGKHRILLGVWNEAQDGEIVAAKLLALVFFQGVAQRRFLLPHGRIAELAQEILEAPLAERAAARAADLVDQPIRGEIERIAVIERKGVVAEARVARIAAIAQPLAVALDLDDAVLVRPPQGETRAGKGHQLLLRVDEADPGLEPVIGLAMRLVLAEQVLHALVQADQDLARLVARGAAEHAVEQAPGDERHEGTGHAMARAIADHHRVAVMDGLEPEEVAADDVARLPDQKMIGRHASSSRRAGRTADWMRLA